MRTWTIAAAVALAVASLACGDDDDGGGGGGSGGSGGTGTHGPNPCTADPQGIACEACQAAALACSEGVCSAEYAAAANCSATCTEVNCCQAESEAVFGCVGAKCPEAAPCATP